MQNSITYPVFRYYIALARRTPSPTNTVYIILFYVIVCFYMSDAGGRPPIEIQELQPSNDFYARYAAELCINETYYDLRFDPASSIHLALRTDQISNRLTGMSQLYHDAERRDLYINRMAVAAELQGLGIGSLLMDHAVELASQLGCDTLSVQPTNTRNDKFYQTHGFQYDREKSQGPKYRWRIFRSLNVTAE